MHEAVHALADIFLLGHWGIVPFITILPRLISPEEKLSGFAVIRSRDANRYYQDESSLKMVSRLCMVFISGYVAERLCGTGQPLSFHSFLIYSGSSADARYAKQLAVEYKRSRFKGHDSYFSEKPAVEFLGKVLRSNCNIYFTK
jgi:hypothetical protein